MAEIGKQFLLEGKIDTFVQASANCRGHGLWWSYRNFPSDENEDFVIMTDLDLIVNFDWIQRLREGLNNIDVCGFSLDMANYGNGQNGGHCEDGCGTWLLALKKSYINNNFKGRSNVMDMDVWFSTTQRRKLGEKLIHLGWDLHTVDPEYYADKVNGTDWMTPVECEYKIIRKEDLCAST